MCDDKTLCLLHLRPNEPLPLSPGPQTEARIGGGDDLS